METTCDTQRPPFIMKLSSLLGFAAVGWFAARGNDLYVCEPGRVLAMDEELTIHESIECSAPMVRGHPYRLDYRCRQRE